MPWGTSSPAPTTARRRSTLSIPRGDGSVLGEYDGSGNLIANYTYGTDLASRVDGVRHRRLLRFRRHGKYRRAERADGRYVDSYSYLPFGEETGATGSVPNPFQYVGQAGVMTAGNGLDFMRARFYSPSTGRFIQRDPTGLAGGANLYAYTAQRPREPCRSDRPCGSA